MIARICSVALDFAAAALHAGKRRASASSRWSFHYAEILFKQSGFEEREEGVIERDRLGRGKRRARLCHSCE
jgi:hypothetical protein